MAKTKHGHLIKSFIFQDDVPGNARQGTELNGEFLGYDLNIQYGAYWAAGKMGQAETDRFVQLDLPGFTRAPHTRECACGAGLPSDKP